MKAYTQPETHVESHSLLHRCRHIQTQANTNTYKGTPTYPPLHMHTKTNINIDIDKHIHTNKHIHTHNSISL